MESCGDRIKFIREELIQLSRPKFEQMAGINRHTLRAWEDNINPIDSKTADDFASKIKDKFGLLVTPQWLIFGTGISPKTMEHSHVDEKIHSDLKKKEKMINELDEFKKNQDNIVIMQKDESLCPQIEPGDFAGGLICSFDEIKFNKLYIIKTEEHTLIRQILKTNNSDTILLEPCNRDFEFIIVKREEIFEIARIMLIRHQ